MEKRCDGKTCQKNMLGDVRLAHGYMLDVGSCFLLSQTIALGMWFLQSWQAIPEHMKLPYQTIVDHWDL